ncbi:CRISPR-associated protein Csx11 [Desulfotomaculum copahuensis]|uniref:CRISPR-associated protein Csx11 n=1 Tax=Desulfotomaculum copahuensis TaxID=1838280 RepID=A0A1B7LAE1_9FIRM|nr:CRISPR-associated protein Csx11 [Desulfotomaculum copahuensis]OAT79302.1 CRISPR-associated protein Csx11 [Desulfotomaculum copahuensis]
MSDTKEFPAAERLRRHRALLLALEAIGWLHMTGKAHRDFLLQHGGKIRDYDQKKWYDGLAESWNNCWGWLSRPSDFKLPSSFDGFLKKFDQGTSEENAIGLLQAAHAMASGVEKNLPKSSSKYLGQDATHMWLATAYGKPVRNLLVNPPALLTGENAWRDLLSHVDCFLAELELLGKSNSGNLGAWWVWREKAAGRDGWLRKAFTGTLAETRLPNNDVTIWDQSYVAAALFKSAAAGALLAGAAFNWSKLKQQTRWRLLTVGIGADHYESRAVRIGDWTGTRRCLDQFIDDVRRLVEVDLAVGSLLYRDDQVAVFSFPGRRLDAKGGLADPEADAWQKYLENEVDHLAGTFKLETPPYCSISTTSSRSIIFMNDEINKARDTLAIPLHKNWQFDCSMTEGNVCPVCGVRLNGTKDKERPCPVCKERRLGRLDAWLGGQSVQPTIWIPEVADHNGRAALLTFKLPVNKWLDGSCVDSLRSQVAAEWCRNNPKVQNYGISPDTAYTDLLNYVKEKVAREFDPGDPVLRLLQDGYQHESDWESFFAKIVEDRSHAPGWNALNDAERAAWLVHQLLRKNASPGRLYRFWRTAEEFFEKLLEEFQEIAAKDTNRLRVRRLVLKPDSSTSTGWKDLMVYNGRYRDIPVTLFYRESSQDFLTVCNVAAFSGKDLKGETILLKDDNDNKVLSLTISKVENETGPLGVYYPVIPLELSPERFRILVPLSAAAECIDRAIKAWNEQFARVWDRMPLRTGVVAFPQKTAFQAVIEAARNLEMLLEDGNKPAVWRVESRVTRNGQTALILVRPDGASELLMVPVQLPDGRVDVFYPYVAVEDREVRFPLDFRTPHGRVYRHVQDLRRGDGVLVDPSRIATIFMESTGSRFEPISTWHLSDWSQMCDIWRLLCGLGVTATALRGAWAILDDARQRWRGTECGRPESDGAVWLSLVRSVVSDRLGARGAVLESLVEAARADLLGPCLDWHMKVLKLSPGEVSR